MSLAFQLSIDCDNSAFGENQIDASLEIARILDAVAHQLREYHSAPTVLRDINGNKVGTCNFIED